MPQDLTNGQNNGQKSISLNLDALGDTVDQQAGFVANDQEKPILETPIEAEIVSTDFRLMTQNGLQSNNNDASKKYYNTVFAVTTRFTQEVVDENGQIIEKQITSRDNYSGLRYFPKLDENGQPKLLADGTPELERFWMGDTSGFGRLFTLVKESDPRVESYRDFFAFFTPGKKCTIKTERTAFPGREPTVKQFIQSFI